MKNERVRRRRTSGQPRDGRGQSPQQASQARANPREARDDADRAGEAARFWPKVDRTAGPHGCWTWTGGTTRNGYGRLKVRRGGRWTHVLAHRWAFEDTCGPIPAGIYLDHLCHTNDPTCAGGNGCRHRRCVNPAHLDGTTDDEENRRRARQRPRSAGSGNHREAT
jgi:hypothetical protein